MELPQVFIDALQEAFEYQKEQSLLQLRQQLAAEGLSAEDQQKIKDAYVALQDLTLEQYTIDLLMPVIDRLLAAKRRAAVVDALNADVGIVQPLKGRPCPEEN